MNTMKQFFLSLIFIYQKLFSPETGIITTNLIPSRHTCAFYPSCSEYTRLSIIKHGTLKGFFLGLRRIGRCHPFQHYQIDPVRND
ncbi:MAG: membrane protein insertion efficiency factor YidD [Patescibacteria group bacterium]